MAVPEEGGIYPVIMCGGSGTRLWPASRRAFPKQFALSFGDVSMFQATLRRFAGSGFSTPVIVTNSDFRFLVSDQAAAVGFPDPRIILEPSARNTAPAILSAALLLEDQPEALMLVVPSDHLINGDGAMAEAVAAAAAAARAGRIVTFGIRPSHPATGFGYLEFPDRPAPGQVAPLTAFVEKPDADTAAGMLASGRYMWNAGIFLFSVRAILDAFRAHAPDLEEPCRAAFAGRTLDLGYIRLDPAAYGQARSISIDYAVMEKAGNVSALPLDVEWSDLGSWDAVWKVEPRDSRGVATVGPATALDCDDTLLRSEDGIHLVGLGLRNVVAVAMRDAVLVADMSHAQRVRDVVDALNRRKIPQADEYPRHHRPWGWYETLCLGDRFQVKRIMVKPGGRLSLQSHLHRAEHWIVVQGTARVTVGDKATLLTENQSVYVPLGETHRMENPGKLPMYLIEVQTGSYLKEDDIIRYEDIYRRV
ncbi:MAG: mannose-1-phosphate guanylyltransferase/mannose-6-phosphate isomerase [Pseudomonadota bacterium]